ADFCTGVCEPVERVVASSRSRSIIGLSYSFSNEDSLMMKHPALASLALVVALSGCANSGMNMNDAAQMASVINAATPNSGTSATRNTVTELLNVFAGTPVTGQQAVGGTAALLGLAQNQLGGSQYT